MNKPQKPTMFGNEPQLINKELGLISSGYPLIIDLNYNYEREFKIEWPDVYNPSESLLEDLASTYMELSKGLKADGDEECGSLYGYRYETSDEISIRLDKEAELEEQYELQLADYEAWLKKELENFNK